VDDARIWEFERELWLGGAEVYRRKIGENCVMALPAAPFLFDGEAAISAVENTPRWEQVEFTDTRVERPQEGLIVIAYRVQAVRGGQAYQAICTSTLLRHGHEDWAVVQHQQTPLGVMVADPDLA